MFCINPGCHLEFEPAAAHCPHCGTISLLCDRYEILKPLRELNPTIPISVFLGFDRTQQQQVVIKVLDYPTPSYRAHFEQEAGVLGNIWHPSLPKVDIDEDGFFSVSTTADRYPEVQCLVMEKVEGETLEALIARQGKVSQSQAVNWLNQLIEIVHVLHQKNVFHRDIKPSNIMVKPDGQLVLIDFGAVREVTQTYLCKLGAGADEMTQMNGITVFNSAAYTAYEQTQGRAMPQSDFFSLGRTIVYALTGISPIKLEENAAGQIQWRTLSPQVSRPLADLLDRMMALLPVNRPKSTTEIKDLLAKLPAQIKRDKIRRSPWVKAISYAAIAAGLLGCFKGYTWYLSERYLSEALRDALEGKYTEAKSELELAILYNPNSPELHGNLAVICQQIGTDDSQQCAITHYQQALQLKPRDSTTIRYNLANLYEETNTVDKSIELYTMVLRETPDFAPARNNLSRLYILETQYAKAEQLLQPALKHSSNQITQAVLLKNWGWLQYERKQYVQAAQSLSQAIALNPDETAAQCLLALTKDAAPKLGASNQFWQSCLSGAAATPEVEFWQAQKLRTLLEPPSKTISRKS
jgi:serine/threonine protein kinase